MDLGQSRRRLALLDKVKAWDEDLQLA